MNSAAVLALDRIGFNSHFLILGGTDPWSVHQLFPPSPLGRSRSCGNPAASFQFTSALPIRQGIRRLRKLPAIQLLQLRGASINNEDAFTPCLGWLEVMRNFLSKIAAFALGVAALLGSLPLALAAQLAREHAAPAARSSAQDATTGSAPSATPR